MKRRASFVAAASLVAVVAGPAAMAGVPTIAPLKLDLGDGWTAKLGGDANLTGYYANQPGDRRAAATASVFAFPRVEKLFANGWRFGFKSTVNLYHDALSGDNYGNDFFAKAYFFLATPYGDMEMGQADGAAYHMAMTGPLVADAVAIDDANIGFFKNPSTGKALTNIFNVRSAVFATANAAKISYYSPRLFGVRIGVSFTPELTKNVIPFVSHAPRIADRQNNIVESAINYTGFFGATSLGVYAGLAAGHNAQRTAGHNDLFDWAAGGEVDQDFGAVVWALGGAYRQSNGYTLDPDLAFKTGTTHVVHASTKLTMGDWSAGIEYSQGIADREAVFPRLDITGYEISAAYRINRNLQLTAGWQHQRFTRSSGAFYNGARALNLDAAFLYLRVHV